MLRDPPLSSLGPRKTWSEAFAESPIDVIKRIHKVHPKQVNYWVMLLARDPRINRDFVLIDAYAGFGTTYEYHYSTARLFEDWEPVQPGDKHLLLIGRFLKEVQAGRKNRLDEAIGHKICKTCNPVPKSVLHAIADAERIAANEESDEAPPD